MTGEVFVVLYKHLCGVTEVFFAEEKKRNREMDAIVQTALGPKIKIIGYGSGGDGLIGEVIVAGCVARRHLTPAELKKYSEEVTKRASHKS